MQVTGSTAFNWFYDWSVVTKNDAAYIAEFRQYNSLAMPATLPFKPYLPGVYMPRLGSSGSAAYWTFSTFNPSASILADVSGHGNNLTNSKSAVENNALWLSRREPFATVLGGGTTGYNLASASPVTFANQSFSWEMYVFGLDSTAPAVPMLLLSTGSILGVGRGYSINFDLVNNRLSFQVGAGGNSGVVTASIASIRSESGQPPNYHYFAGTHLQGEGLILYIDGQQVAFQSYTFGVDAAPETFKVKGGPGLFIDEFVLYGGVIDPNALATKYLYTKERQRRIGMSKGTWYPYHQARFTAFCSGSNEFELHAFSVRGLGNVSGSVFDPRTTDLYVLPVFSSPSGSAGQAIGGIFFQ